LNSSNTLQSLAETKSSGASGYKIHLEINTLFALKMSATRVVEPMATNEDRPDFGKTGMALRHSRLSEMRAMAE